VEPAPKDPILGVTDAFLADPSPNKVNVGVVSSFFTFKKLFVGLVARKTDFYFYFLKRKAKLFY
jgi:aspartate/tyrosine/aromatic aminotransferase